MFDSSMFDIRPAADPRAVVRGEKYRFTVLTDRMLRLEWDESGRFQDSPTKLALCRQFSVPEFTVRDTESSLEIITKELHLYYNKQPFSQGGLSIAIRGMHKHKCAKWHYRMEPIIIHNAPINLHGTASTLDSIDGPCRLEDGLLDRHGFSTVEDTDTMVLGEDGWYVPSRREGCVDLYFFGYLRDHKGCIRDFYRLSGAAPMLPRFALGNWWSRYYKYTEQTYMELMQTFAQKQIPLSVSVLDMDWHITEPEAQYGNGWTGYTWNREFFPDPPRFLRRLHELGLKVTANLHPCDGIRAFEDCYEAAAESMGIDPESREPVQFDAADPRFMKTYLEQVLHPLEAQGMDFWWIDWQQRGGFSQDGYDPLWMLNHYLYADNARKGEYPLTLSRYAGLGSHRYPLGFSGDTVMSWESLAFQPFFTNCASNVGYGWWSHDIGGHTRGIWDDELQVRWVQYGVFSPIFRLHSAKNTFLLKEPWSFPVHIEGILSDYMRLRHRLIPYLYTMNYRAHAEGIPLICPLYYDYPVQMTDDKEFLNEYLFGSELLVCPITEKTNPRSQTGRAHAWIPDGIWYDIFTGLRYRGEKKLDLYRGLAQYPVLAKAGGILPLSDDPVVNGAPIPQKLHVQVFCGADGSFRLYEDDGCLHNTRQAWTPMAFTWGENARFRLSAVEGAASVVPVLRDYRFCFVGMQEPACVTVLRNQKGEKAHVQVGSGAVTVTVEKVSPTDTVELLLQGSRLAENDLRSRAEKRLPRYQIENVTKQAIADAMAKADCPLTLAGSLTAVCKDAYILGELMELLTADTQSF